MSIQLTEHELSRIETLIVRAECGRNYHDAVPSERDVVLGVENARSLFERCCEYRHRFEEMRKQRDDLNIRFSDLYRDWMEAVNEACKLKSDLASSQQTAKEATTQI